MSFRALAVLALLVLAIAAERCGYFSARTFLVIDLTAAGMTSNDARNVLRTISLVGYAAPFAGGGLAFLVGPRATAVVGAMLASLAAFAIAAGAPITVMSFVLTIGAGIFKPATYAAAAEVLIQEDGSATFTPSPRNFAIFATFTTLAYAAINLGSMIAPLFTGMLRDTASTGLLGEPRNQAAGIGAAYGFACAVDLFAAILAGIALFLGSGAAKSLAQQAHAPYRQPDPTGAAPIATRPPEAVFGPLVLVGVLYACAYLVLDSTHPNPVELGLPRASWLFSVNPVVILVMSVPCGALFLVLAMQRSAVPLTTFLGIGSLIFAFGGLLGLAAVLTHAGLALWVPALVLTAIGEAVIFPVGLAYAALALRTRAATMVVAGWVSLTSAPTFLFFGLSTTRNQTFATGVAVLAAIAIAIGGVLVLVNAKKLHAALGGHSNATS